MRSSPLIAYAEAARAADLSPTACCDNLACQTRRSTTGDLKISAERVADLIDTSATKAGREDFRPAVGAAFKLAMKGPLGLLLRERATVGKAIEALAHYIEAIRTPPSPCRCPGPW